jgi:tetratricopeptide (TPR) repeat protein/predicted Ser/Thr protein kinase
MPAKSVLRRRADGTVNPELGQFIGRYEIVGHLGSGGMGQVYRAVDPELEREVAIKVHKMEQGRGDLDELRGRLLREARALARVSDPNVVAVYDVGLFRGQVFVAMELVEGKTLGEWLRECPRTPAEIIDRYLEMASGLAAAHRVGLVHRDVKPDNAIVGNDGRLRVVDFGLARSDHAAELSMLQIDTAGLARVTETGMVMGTPAYMAPEQIEGRMVADRADQFSFCVSLWEALSGELPFAGQSLAERATSIEAGPSFVGESKLARGLRTVLERGLRPAAVDRHGTMDGLAGELRRAVSRPRRRKIAAVLGLLALAAVLASVWYPISRIHLDALEQRIDGEYARASELYFLGRLDEAHAKFERLLAEPQLSELPGLESDVCLVAMRTLMELKDFARASQVAERLLPIAMELGPDRFIALAWNDRLHIGVENATDFEMAELITRAHRVIATLDAESALLLEFGIASAQLERRDLARAHATAIQTLQKARDSGLAFQEALALTILARWALLEERYLEAESFSIEGLGAFERSPISAVPDRVSLIVSRATALYQQGQLANAKQMFNAAYEQLVILPRTDSSEALRFLLRFANERVSQGHWAEARIALEQLDRTQAIDKVPWMIGDIEELRARIPAAR